MSGCVNLWHYVTNFLKGLKTPINNYLVTSRRARSEWFKKTKESWGPSKNYLIAILSQDHDLWNGIFAVWNGKQGMNALRFFFFLTCHMSKDCKVEEMRKKRCWIHVRKSMTLRAQCQQMEPHDHTLSSSFPSSLKHYYTWRKTNPGSHGGSFLPVTVTWQCAGPAGLSHLNQEQAASSCWGLEVPSF